MSGRRGGDRLRGLCRRGGSRVMMNGGEVRDEGPLGADGGSTLFLYEKPR